MGELTRIGRWSGNIERWIRRSLTTFFTWSSRTFTPRRHAERLAIEASRRSANVVPDVRGGEGSRLKIKQIIAENNKRRGSKFIKQRPKVWAPKTD